MVRSWACRTRIHGVGMSKRFYARFPLRRSLTAGAQDQDGGRTMRLRMITPGAKSLLGVPLQYRNRTYGFLVIGRKESAAFTKKERGLMDQASEDVTKALDREKLFDMNVVLSRPLVNQEQVSVALPPRLYCCPRRFRSSRRSFREHHGGPDRRRRDGQPTTDRGYATTIPSPATWKCWGWPAT